MVFRLGLRSAAKYINKFRKCLVNCADMSEAEFIFEMNLAV